MKTRKDVICIDVDGPFIDFKKIDNEIIKTIFSKSKLVMWLDEILWKINDLDIVEYNRLIFYFRMFLYSLISFNNIWFVFSKYERMYYLLAKEQITKEKLDMIEKLKNMDYDICFVTRNMYVKHLTKFIGFKTFIVKNKRKFYLKNDVKYIIGNNYSDDIFSGYLLNFKNRFLKKRKELVVGIYIGKSKIVNRILSTSCLSFYDLDSCVKYFSNKEKKYISLTKK